MQLCSSQTDYQHQNTNTQFFYRPNAQTDSVKADEGLPESDEWYSTSNAFHIWPDPKHFIYIRPLHDILNRNRLRVTVTQPSQSKTNSQDGD